MFKTLYFSSFFLRTNRSTKNIPFSSEPAQVLSHDWTDDEDGQLEDAEDEAVLRGRGPLLLGLVRVERGLKGNANGGTKICDREHEKCQLLTTVEVGAKHLLCSKRVKSLKRF